LSTTYGPKAATSTDASRATLRSAGTLADPAVSWNDRQAALEAEAAAYESYWQAHGRPAYAEHSAREGLVREHAGRGLTLIAAEHQAEAAEPGKEAGE
jgi:uncharacterized protein YfaQ (DUF2300 family)